MPPEIPMGRGDSPDLTVVGALMIRVEKVHRGQSDFVRLMKSLEQELLTEHGVREPGERPGPDAACFLARLQGAAIGCVAVTEPHAGVAELKRMYVLPRRRGLGAAQQLLEAAERHASMRGARTMTLTTGISQASAVRLYRRAGWVEAVTPTDDSSPSLVRLNRIFSPI